MSRHAPLTFIMTHNHVIYVTTLLRSSKKVSNEFILNTIKIDRLIVDSYNLKYFESCF